jgi:hypothetical protein
MFSSFSLPDLKQILHAQLSSAIGHLIDLESLSEEQFDVRLSGLSSTLTLRDVALNSGVRIGNGTMAASSMPTSTAASMASMQTLAGGCIRHFSVSIPLSTLVRKTNPIEVCLHGLEIVVGMEDAVNTDVARACWDAEKRLLVDREARYETEGRDSATASQASSSNGNKNLIGSLLRRVVCMGLSRLQLDLRDVRLRVVDMKTGKEMILCWMDRMETVDDNICGTHDSLKGVPPPFDELVEGLRHSGSSKVLRVQGVGVRWCGSGNASMASPSENKMTYARMDCTLRVLYDINTSPSQLLCLLHVDSVEAAVNVDEMGDILALTEDLEWQNVRRRVAHLRPSSLGSKHSGFDAGGMWRFAINSVLFEMAGPSRFAPWRPEGEVVRDRRRYILLYRKMLDVRASMSAIGEKEVERLEGRLSVSDVVACRGVALRSCGSLSIATNSSTATMKMKSGMVNPNASAAWSKIPALVDLEEQLFQALDVDQDCESITDDIECTSSSSLVLSFSKVQVVTVVQVPRAVASVRSDLFGFNLSIVVSDVDIGYVNDILDGSGTEPRQTSSSASLGAAYATVFVRHVEVSTPRNSRVLFHSPFILEYIGVDNIIRVELAKGVEIVLAPEDLRGIVESIPTASPEAYSLHWIETAISMEKKAYCIETVRRLQRLGNFVDFDVRLGATTVDIECLHIRMTFDSMMLRTAMESDNFEDLQKIYRIISSFGSDAIVDNVGTTDSPISARSAMQELENRLIYREIDVSLNNLSIEHAGVPVVHPLQGVAKTKVNRLFGDFSHPQVVAELGLGEVSIDMFDACLSSFLQLRDALMTNDVAVEDTWRIQRTISVGIGWSSLCVRWLAYDGTFRHQFSVNAGRTAMSTRLSFPRSMSADISLDVADFQVLHLKGMESVDIPMVDVQIPYFARSFSLERLVFELKARPKSRGLNFESRGISLAGDDKDTSNFIKSTTLSDASIRARYVEQQGEPATLDASISNVDIGHGTLMRALVLSQLMAEQGTTSEASSGALGTPKMHLRMSLVIQNIRCSFLHEMAYSIVPSTPVQYHDFSTIHPTVAQARLAKLGLECDIGEKSAIRVLELDSLMVTCGMLRERGAALGVVFSVPQILCHIGTQETLLDCPHINVGISPYQLSLIKGISNLISFDHSRYIAFYADLLGADVATRHQLGDRRQGEHSGDISPESDTPLINFDPIRVIVGALDVCVLGVVPTAGSVWLCGRSITLGARPGDARVVWDALEVFHCPQMHLATHNDRGVGSMSSAGSSDGDSSVVVYHDVARTFTSGSSSSSKLFDAISTVSRDISESSFMTSFHSVGEDEDNDWEGMGGQEDVVATAPPLPEEKDLVGVFKLCFDNVPDMGAVLTMMTGQHVLVSISSIRVHIGVDALAQMIQFLRTYERYISNHILGGVCMDASHLGGAHPAPPPVATPSLALVKELLLEADRVMVLLETRDKFKDMTGIGIVESSFGEKSAKSKPATLQHMITLSFGSQLKYTNGSNGQACSLGLDGFLVSSFSLSGDVHDLSKAFLESHALAGGRDCSIQCSSMEGVITCDISCSQASFWLSERNLIPLMRVARMCQASANACRDSIVVANTVGRVDTANTTDDGISPPNGVGGNVFSANIGISMRRLSIAIASFSLSNQKKHLFEVDVNNVAISAQYRDGMLLSAASFGVEAAVSKVSDSSWIVMLDETAFRLEASIAHDLVTLTVNVGPANFTVSSHIVECISLCSMVLRRVTAPNDSFTPAPYLTICRLVNETTYRFYVVLEGEALDGEDAVNLLEPGASLFPRQAHSFPYKAGIPDNEFGIVNSGVSSQPTVGLTTIRHASVWVESSSDDLFTGTDGTFQAPESSIIEATTATEGLIPLESDSTVYRALQHGEIVLHTSKSESGTWTTHIRPCIRFINDTDLRIEIARLGSDEIVAVAGSHDEVWLPVSAVFGEYRFRADNSNWCESVRLLRNMASRGYVRHIDVIFRDGTSLSSTPITISGEDGSICVTASPKINVCNLMPLPVHLSLSAVPTLWIVKPGCRFSFPNSGCNLPLTLELCLAGFSEVKHVVVSELRGNAVIKWEEKESNEYVESLDVAFKVTGKPLGASELFGRLTASKERTSGTIVISLVAPVWVYNYAGVPISFDCLLAAGILDSGNVPVGDSIIDTSASLADAVEDTVPDTWIPPLEPASSTRDPLPSTPSIHVHDRFPDAAGMSDLVLDTDQGLASISVGLSSVPGTRVSTGLSADFGANSTQSPTGSFHYSAVGLGSLVSHIPTPRSPMENPNEVDSADSLLRHSRVINEPCFAADSPLTLWKTSPTGLNAQGARMMSQSVKRLRIRVTRQKAPLGLSYWSSTVTLDPYRWHDIALVPLPPSTTGMHLYNTRPGEYPVIVSMKRDDVAQSMPQSVEKLTISPQFVVINHLGAEIHYRQQGTYIETRILPGDFSAVQWTDIGLPRKLSVRIQKAGWMWSGGFSLDNAGDLFLKLRHRDRGITHIVRAEISHSSEDGTKKIILRSNPEGFTPYRLDNCSLETLTIRQKGVFDQQDVLRPYCSLNYTWDEPSMVHQVTVERPGGQIIGCFDLDKVGFEEVMGGKKNLGLEPNAGSRLGLKAGEGRSAGMGASSGALVIRVTAEGPVRVLTIMDLNFHPRNNNAATAIQGKELESNEFELHCKLDTISLSIFHMSKERLFFGIHKLELSCLMSSSRMAILGSIRSVALENTSSFCVYPVIFALPAPESTLSSRVRKGIGESNPFKWEFTLWRDIRKEHSIACFDVADIYVRSFSIYIEQDLINLLLDMSASDAWSLPRGSSHVSGSPEASGIQMSRSPASTSFSDVPSLEPYAAGMEADGDHELIMKKFYFDRMSISPVELMISFNSSVAEEWNDWSGALVQQVIALADIEDARVWLSGIHLSNALFDQQAMTSYLATHYKRALLLEIFKLVGAANVLGDPMATIHHIGLGFWEFISFPATGLVQSCRTFSPTDFVLGCVQGTKGLLQNVLFAVSNATTKASSAARKTIRLTWGDDNGSSPSESLVGATLRGFIGLVTEPIKGAEEGGLPGFLSGVRHGALGAMLIPTSAWLQMCASLALSIRKAVAGTANVGWSRPPRVGEDLPYDWTDSMGRWLFCQIQQEMAGNDEYVCCSRLDKDTYLILTSRRVAVTLAEGLNWTPKMIWTSRLDMLEVVTLEERTNSSESSFALRLVCNPEPLPHLLRGFRELRLRKERKLFSVFEAEFADQKQDAIDFREKLDDYRRDTHVKNYRFF